MCVHGHRRASRESGRKSPIHAHSSGRRGKFVLAGAGGRRGLRLHANGARMSIGLTKMTEDAEKLLDQGRILPALELLKQTRSMTKIPVRRLFLTFNIGALYWDKLGDGLSARDEFLEAANAEGSDIDHTAARVLRANA